jgi:hypothetical protein
MDVRSESRSALIAYGFLKGKQYHQIEQPAVGKRKGRRPPPDWNRIAQIAVKYGPDKNNADVQKALSLWQEGVVAKKKAA